jgi:phytoene dehydrogenase-like protein
VLAAVDAWELGRLLGRPSTMRPDPAVVKVEWTLDGTVPWTSEPARRAPVVHLGGPGRFTIFGQYAVADQTRAPAGKETAWAYSHDLPDADAIEGQVEELAPGFRALVRGRRDERMPPGTVNLGTMGRALVLRGRLGRPETGVPGVYLASASAHPGGGVHGAPGWIAAQAALRSERSPFRRPRRAESFTSSST